MEDYSRQLPRAHCQWRLRLGLTRTVDSAFESHHSHVIVSFLSSNVDNDLRNLCLKLSESMHYGELNFCDVSQEIKYLIACSCSPLDLVVFSRLNRECRDIVVSRNLFQRSILRLGGPALDRTFLLPSLIAFVFTETACWTCGKPTDRYPLSFSLRIRVCNDQCKTILFKNSSDDVHKFAIIPAPEDRTGNIVHLEHILQWAPYLEGSGKDKKVYSTQQLTSAIYLFSDALEADDEESLPPTADAGTTPGAKSLLLEEWSRRAAELPALMDGANRLLAWRSTYEKRKRKYSVLNDKMAKDMTFPWQVGKAYILRSPTLVRTLEIFSRDHDTFTIHAFETIADVVYSEARDLEYRRPVLHAAYGKPANKVQCCFCDCRRATRVYSVPGLLQHIHKRHPKDFPKARGDLQV